jgi:NADH-quinone oxidoreductase subunit F
MAGSGGIVVLDEDTDMVGLALRTIKFYQHESCGFCIPCREGTTWLKKILERFHEGGGREKDIDMIHEIAKGMFGRTFCPLGDAAAMPTYTFIEKFRDEFEAYLTKARPKQIPELALL